MEKTQRSSRKRGCGILAIVILVIIVSAIGGVLIKAATYKPKTEADAKLYEIASMFGKSRLGFSILDMFLDLTPDQQMKEDIYRTVTGIQDEIDACGVDPDFMAPPAITGDNLFDAYAGEVDRLLNTPLRSKEDVLEAALIPEEVLGGWEERFGDDPRYWELRYLLAKTHDLGSRNTGNSQVSSTTANAVQYLEEAHSRGVASANTLLLLYAEQVEAGEAALEGLTTYDPAQGYWRPQAIDEQLSNRPEFTPEVLDQARQIHA